MAPLAVSPRTRGNRESDTHDRGRLLNVYVLCLMVDACCPEAAFGVPYDTEQRPSEVRFTRRRGD
jgi:hypothetical protein